MNDHYGCILGWPTVTVVRRLAVTTGGEHVSIGKALAEAREAAGLSVDEIARAFLVPPRTMEQRLTRARKRLRERGDCEEDAA